jgi:hypothetical protein
VKVGFLDPKKVLTSVGEEGSDLYLEEDGGLCTAQHTGRGGTLVHLCDREGQRGKQRQLAPAASTSSESTTRTPALHCSCGRLAARKIGGSAPEVDSRWESAVELRLGLVELFAATACSSCAPRRRIDQCLVVAMAHGSGGLSGGGALAQGKAEQGG